MRLGSIGEAFIGFVYVSCKANVRSGSRVQKAGGCRHRRERKVVDQTQSASGGEWNRGVRESPQIPTRGVSYGSLGCLGSGLARITFALHTAMPGTPISRSALLPFSRILANQAVCNTRGKPRQADDSGSKARFEIRRPSSGRAGHLLPAGEGCLRRHFFMYVAQDGVAMCSSTPVRFTACMSWVKASSKVWRGCFPGTVNSMPSALTRREPGRPTRDTSQ